MQNEIVLRQHINASAHPFTFTLQKMSILRSFPLLFTTPIYVATYYLYSSTVKIILPPEAYKTYSSEMEKAHKVILDYYFK